MEIAILIWIVCGIGAAFVAQRRGANGCLWFGLGVLLGPFGLAFAFTSGSDRYCPACKKGIHLDASNARTAKPTFLRRGNTGVPNAEL